MRAAIYARKSTDDDRSEENKSITRQVERACSYARAKGWTVDEDHIYTDDGISGAEYVNRPAFARLIASLPKRGAPPFDILVMSEASRLGRDMTRNAAYVVSLLESGVCIFYYLTDEEEKADTPEQKIMVTLRSYASEVERLKAGQRSRDALERKAAKGYNSGGIVYGYDNVPVYVNGPSGEQIKSHTDYRVNENQAAVIRGIFSAYAAGHGHVSIAKTLNGDPRYTHLSGQFFGGARPASPRKGTGSWAPSSLRAMLYNERYTGVVPFGEYRKVYRRGTKARVRQAEQDIQRASRPDLRIVHDALWSDVQARLETAKKTYLRDTNGRLWGRPGSGIESRYLLTGFGTCGCCGRSITMIGGRSGVPGRRDPTYYYGCSYHQNRGRTICGNDAKARMEEADSLVISRIQETILTPAARDLIVERAVKTLAERKSEPLQRPDALRMEVQRERRQRDNFLDLIADGKAPQSVIEKVAALDASIAEKEHRLAELAEVVQSEPPSELELRRLKKSLTGRLEQFDDLLHANIPLARQALRKLLAGRIEFHPEQRGGASCYRLRWSLVTKPLIGEGYIGVASPRDAESTPPIEWESETVLRPRWRRTS